MDKMEMGRTHDIFVAQTARKPDHYPQCKLFIKAMNDGFWTVDKFDFRKDIHDFNTRLTEQEKGMVLRVSSTIAQVEVAVKEYWSKIGVMLPHPSIKDAGFTLAESEVRHNAAYEKILEVLDMEHLFEENLKLPILANRVKYLTKHSNKVYENNKKQFVYSLILFSCFVENVSLFSQFYVISWFKKEKNSLADFANQVGYTRNEELCHFLFGVYLVSKIREEHPELFDADLEARIRHEAEEAVNAEMKIIEWMLGDYNQKGLNKEILIEYVKNRMNNSLVELGFKPIYIINESLIAESVWADEETIGNSLTDFFAGVAVEYKEAGITINEEDLFLNDEEFKEPV